MCVDLLLIWQSLYTRTWPNVEAAVSKNRFFYISVASVTRAFVLIDSSSRFREMFSIMLSSILFSIRLVQAPVWGSVKKSPHHLLLGFPLFSRVLLGSGLGLGSG